MHDRALSIFGITIGAFFAGIGLGYALQVWDVRIDAEEIRATAYEKGFDDARAQYAPAGDQPGCRAAGEPFTAQPGDTFKLCGNDVIAGISSLSADKLLSLTIGGVADTARPPEAFAYPATDRECSLLYYAFLGGDGTAPQAQVGFECS